MASFTFQKLPGATSQVSASGNHIKISMGAQARMDAHQTVIAPPGTQTFSICMPLSPGGDVPLQRVAIACLQDGWETRLDRESDWQTVHLVLDNQNGWETSYHCSRLLISHWELRSSSDGVGIEEVLSFQAFKMERRMNGAKPISLDLTRPVPS